MDQLAMLWQYQVEDRKADKLEQELSRSPLRQKMNTCRTQFNAKQKQYKKMEEQVAILSDRKDAIRDAIKLKEEFDNLKKQYDKESPEKEAALKAQKAIVAKKGEGISPELLARYHEIKKRITPPLARLINNQCSGCNMSLPSAVLRRVTSANGEFVECESCGRLLIP